MGRQKTVVGTLKPTSIECHVEDTPSIAKTVGVDRNHETVDDEREEEDLVKGALVASASGNWSPQQWSSSWHIVANHAPLPGGITIAAARRMNGKQQQRQQIGNNDWRYHNRQRPLMLGV